jgi:ribonuclease HI
MTTGHTIQVLHNSAFLYDSNGQHLHTIPITRLKWLWDQYNHSLPHLPTLEPPLQSFKTEIIWLIYRYNYPKNIQYALPNNILDHLTTTFNITHSYFSSPITCSTLLKQFYSPFPRDCIFGSSGNALSHKWNGCGFAHPPPQMLPQAIHMARITAKTNPLSYTILINTYPNWHQKTNPFITQYTYTHVITYIPPNILQYHVPLTPTYNKQTHIEKLAIQILCIHHKTTTIGDISTMQQLNDYFPNTPLLIQIAQPTPPHTKVQIHKTWHTLPDPPPLLYTHHITNPLPNYTFVLPIKFPPEYSYYTDGSFKPPKQISANNWQPKTASYGIYSPIKDLQISKRLPGLQNILRAELMALYMIIKLSTTTYTEEPVYIFTDSLNSLYLINTQLRHPSTHNNHPDKTILSQIASMLTIRTQPIALHKVKAHANIIGNEIVDALAKRGHIKPHSLPNEPYEHAHSTPYYLHKDEWIGMHYTPYKGPIRNFQRYIQKYTTDIISSNAFWNNPQISESQIKQLIKFRTNQYMGNAHKYLFWPLRYPTITCSLCSTNEVDTWPHVLLKCPQPHLHALRIKRHNKAV